MKYMSLTINPTGGHDLKECQKHDGYYGSVMIHQLENIDSHLDKGILFRTARKVKWAPFNIFFIWFKFKQEIQFVPAWHKEFQRGRLRNKPQEQTVPFSWKCESRLCRIDPWGWWPSLQPLQTAVWEWDIRISLWNTMQTWIPILRLPVKYLTVQSEAKQHKEEQHCPELSHWHVGKGLRVNNKN